MLKTVFLNADKIDFDGRLDFTSLEQNGSVTRYGASAPDEIPDRVSGYDVVVTKELPVGREVIDRFPASVKLICEAGTGYNNIDIAAAREKGIAVCNIPEYSTEAVAQLVITFILSLSASLHLQQAMLRRNDLTNFTQYLEVPHAEVAGKTLGVIGAGKIGKRVIDLGRALGMDVLVYNRTVKDWAEEKIRFVSLDQLLSQSDFISIHCPLTPDTARLIDAKTLDLVKPSAYLINTARGAIVHEEALIAALKQQKLAGAALDVQETEPPAPGSQLYTLANVILTPHIGWKARETRQRLLDCLAATIKQFGLDRPINVVS